MFQPLARHQHHAQRPFSMIVASKGLSFRFIFSVRSYFPNWKERCVSFLFFYFPILDNGLVWLKNVSRESSSTHDVDLFCFLFCISWQLLFWLGVFGSTLWELWVGGCIANLV
jgi:hypothetical protein